MPRLLLTAGPTREPIDAVRFIGNRSSGRMGLAIAAAADAAAAASPTRTPNSISWFGGQKEAKRDELLLEANPTGERGSRASGSSWWPSSSPVGAVYCMCTKQ